MGALGFQYRDKGQLEGGMSATVDIVIPVYNEDINIVKLIKYLKSSSNYISKIYICYDFDDDSSVNAIKNSKYEKRDLSCNRTY